MEFDPHGFTAKHKTSCTSNQFNGGAAWSSPGGNGAPTLGHYGRCHTWHHRRGSSVACCDGRSPHEDNHVHENRHIYVFLVILVDNIVEELLSDDNKRALRILLLQAGAVLLASP
jgi:hypothetical protein